MSNLTEKTLNYLNWLIGELGLSISIHFKDNVLDELRNDISDMIIPFNRHTGRYCMLVKNFKHKQCIIEQNNIIESCSEDKCYHNVCHAGVYQFIYPLRKNDFTVGFVAVSGYRKDCNSNIVNNEVWTKELSENTPADLLSVVIPPLCLMLESLLDYTREETNEYTNIIHFLSEYHTNITLEDVALRFNRSRSHISHLFKKNCGMSLRAYCNDLKLEDSIKLLEKTNLSVTEIAYDTGFTDTSYFINLFKKKFGVSPLKYRNVHSNKKI